VGWVTAAGVVVGVASLLLGYVIGSLPLSMLVGRMAGLGGDDAAGRGADGAPGAASATPSPSSREAGAAAVWRLAGPGWGFLAVVADLARGVLPVALAAATFSWAAGWAAGFGALLGTAWPALGRLRSGGSSVIVLAGALFALEPAAGLLAAAVAAAVAGGARTTGRSVAARAATAGIGAYAALFLLLELDPVRLAAVAVLDLLTAVNVARTAR